MKRLLTPLAIVLLATSCSAPNASSEVSAPPSAISETATPTPAPVEVDVAKSKSATTSNGIEVTFVGTRIAEASEIGSDPQADMVPVVVQLEYRNLGTEAATLQAVPLNVFYGADKYKAKQPTLYQGGTTHTELPKQITPGSVVKVADTYWAPAGSALTVEVNPSGPSSGILPVIFSGITAK
ncbi:hypothetical protein ABIE18_000138 [Arthrobacter sp. 2762]